MTAIHQPPPDGSLQRREVRSPARSELDLQTGPEPKDMEDTMRRSYRMLFMVVLSLTLATTTTALATAAPTPTTIADQSGQRKALYQSELEQNLLLRSQMGYTFIAEYGPLRTPPA
jgi:hypothetical protein